MKCYLGFPENAFHPSFIYQAWYLCSQRRPLQAYVFKKPSQHEFSNILRLKVKSLKTYKLINFVIFLIFRCKKMQCLWFILKQDCSLLLILLQKEEMQSAFKRIKIYHDKCTFYFLSFSIGYFLIIFMPQ